MCSPWLRNHCFTLILPKGRNSCIFVKDSFCHNYIALILKLQCLECTYTQNTYSLRKQDLKFHCVKNFSYFKTVLVYRLTRFYKTCLVKVSYNKFSPAIVFLSMMHRTFLLFLLSFAL